MQTIATAAMDTSFLHGIRHFADTVPDMDQLADQAAVDPVTGRIADPGDRKAAYQTLLAADALRYLTLLATGTKSSGHPGGFASIAEAYAALIMLGHRNIVTEVGHHAPGFYSALFLDTSLEARGIRTAEEFAARYRERGGLLGHLSGAIPGVLAPAGPLGQGQHFAMALARLYPGTLFPVTIGDGGLGEPYIMSSMLHFATAFPAATNFLPVLVWNGYSQEHHSMVSLWTNDRMTEFWRAHGFKKVHLVDAKDFDDAGQEGPYVDSTRFSWTGRMAFASAVLRSSAAAATAALTGEWSVLIVKQLKGAGVHAAGAKSHNLYPRHTLDTPEIEEAMKRRALPQRAWGIVRTNFTRAGGGPAAKVAMTERPPLSAADPIQARKLAAHEFPVGGENAAPTTAVGALAAAVGAGDPSFIATNADGNEASGMANLNVGLSIRHPTADSLYSQGPEGRVYEPISEDACAGLAAATALFGGRALWASYESFAINGLPIWQTVTQAMAELRRPTPAAVALFTAGALEQGRNGWTHQRPEIEAYLASMLRNGNVYPLFPIDANMAQAAYLWALEQRNKGVVITVSKSALPLRSGVAQGTQAIGEGAFIVRDSAGAPRVVFAVVGDMVLSPVLEAAERLHAAGIATRVVAVVNPRRLYRPTDVAWDRCAEPDGVFLDQAGFDRFFAADAVIGVSGGSGAVLEPVLLRSTASKRDLICWKRGETSSGPDELYELNGMTAGDIENRARALLG